MLKLALVAAFVACAFAATVEEQFAAFKQTYSKSYLNAAEERHRLSVFAKNLAFIEKHNAEYARGVHSFDVGVNQFADLTAHEFGAMFNGLRLDATRARDEAALPSGSLPPSVDWRTKGVVTGVKNQGQCGSCWSFSTTGSTEGQHAIVSGSLVSLSEQNLIDCSTAEGNQGCNGGLMDQAFEYIIKNNGIDTEASYPYTATGPNKCKFDRANVGATLYSYKDVPSKNEQDLQAAIATVGPISVAIDASHNSFQLYKSGVYYEPACSQTALDHGVLAVGYGATTTPAKDYYIVKNSWGTTWGMQGYIWMSRNRNNNCGIATSASYPNATQSAI